MRTSWYVFPIYGLALDNDTSVPNVIQNILAGALKTLPLTRLRLRVGVRWVNPAGTPWPSPPPTLSGSRSSPPPPPPPCIAETSAAHINVPAFLRTLCAAIPTLMDAYITLHRWSAVELRARVHDGGIASSDTGDTDEECVHWACVTPTREAQPELEEDKEMFEFD